MSATQHSEPANHGLLAGFDRPEPLVAAVKAARQAGFTRLEAFSPMPIHALSEALGLKNRVAPLVLAGGLLGAAVGFALQYWVSVIEYPLDIGGRPWNSWPAFIVPMFECTILFASLSAFFGMLALNGLPQPYHALFNLDSFSEASRQRFFLLIESSDPLSAKAREFLAAQQPLSLEEVPH